MTTPGPELALLSQALASEWGIEVATSDFKLARQRLYAARRSSPALEQIQIRQAPGGEGRLWLCKLGKAPI